MNGLAHLRVAAARRGHFVAATDAKPPFLSNPEGVDALRHTFEGTSFSHGTGFGTIPMRAFIRRPPNPLPRS